MNYPKNRYTGPKPWMDYDWLYDQYITKNRRTVEIAEEYGCKPSTIGSWIYKFKLKKPVDTRYHAPKFQYQQHDYLFHNHIELHRSMAEIAAENGVSSDTIRYNLKKNGIEPWQTVEKPDRTDEEIEDIISLYCDKKLSTNEIAKRYNTTHGTIKRYLKKNGIKIRGLSEAQFAHNGVDYNDDLNDKDLLESLHWDNNMTCEEIGLLYGIHGSTVRRIMQRIGARTKTNAESKVGYMVGEKHPNWRGGITPLHLLLREYFHVNQVPVIAKRDNYTCQLCGANHTVLHVHHIRPFSEIIREICDEYPELSPSDTDDMQKLYDIITHDSRFLDEDNLITYCRDCHFFKVHKYNRKTISSQAS